MLMMGSEHKVPKITVIAITGLHLCILLHVLNSLNFYTPLARNDASCFCYGVIAARPSVQHWHIWMAKFHSDPRVEGLSTAINTWVQVLQHQSVVDKWSYIYVSALCK